ncbi:MAG: hypothetical protein K9W43_04955 [Candidatus Thorarchaeota archaeon]|nr:hypothetical protein [Candidatus Thorarchaeota archaeon]
MSEHRFLPLFLLGLLSMTFAEVFSGSSPLWPFDLIIWLIAFPLYWSHILFFLGLAVRYHRFSIPHLYLWGILFGLYESWMTKVVWGGFMVQTAPPAIQILGIAVVETVMIIFFWHPLFSFIIPILAYQMLMRTNETDSSCLTGHSKWLTPSRRNKTIGIVIAIMGGAGLAGGAGYDVVSVVPVAIACTLLILIVYKLASRGESSHSIESIILGSKGLMLVGLFIAAYYALTFPTWLPERIPGADGIIVTLLFYIVIVLILRASPKIETVFETANNSTIVGESWFFRIMGLFIIMAAIMALVPPLDFLLFATEVYGMLIVGPALFLIALVRLRRLGKASMTTE